MITQLIGKLIAKKPPLLVLDVNGVGYEVLAPMNTFYALPDIHQTITLLTHLVVREDAHTLYGFLKDQDRVLFRALIKVNGIGPKLALTILSGIETKQFVQCVQMQNAAYLTNIPGIGKKTAERLLIEMKSVLAKWEMDFTINPNQIMQDAIAALTALGYKPHIAKQSVSKVYDAKHSSEQLIRLALQQLAV